MMPCISHPFYRQLHALTLNPHSSAIGYSFISHSLNNCRNPRHLLAEQAHLYCRNMFELFEHIILPITHIDLLTTRASHKRYCVYIFLSHSLTNRLDPRHLLA